MSRSDQAWPAATESWLDELQVGLRRERVRIDTVVAVDREGGPPAARFEGFMALAAVTWQVAGELVVRAADGVVVVSALEMRALRPADMGITARLAAKLPISLITKRALAKLEDDVLLNAWAEALGVPAGIAPAEAARLRSTAKRIGRGASPPRGRGGAPREFYDAVATEAVALSLRGLPVIAGLAKSRGRPERTVKGWIAKARSDEVGALDPHRGVWKFGPDHPVTTKRPGGA